MTAPIDSDALVVKALTRKAVAAAGGTKMAEPLIRQQRLSDLQNVNEPDIVRLTEAAALDELSPAWPHFAHYLAARAGCALVKLPAAAAVDSIWSQRIGTLLKEVGDMASGLGGALAHDSGEGDRNDVAPGEALQLIADADEMLAAAVEIREALVRRAEGRF